MWDTTVTINLSDFSDIVNMNTVIIFIIVLSILVFVHEFGHFITARMFRMKVYEFALGFPPRIIGVYKDPKTGKLHWHWGFGKKAKALREKHINKEGIEEFPATLYTFNLLPLGGYCKIKGENGEKEAEKDSFGHHAWWKRLIVLSAGVFMNFLLAGFLLGFGLMVGLPTDISLEKDPDAIIVGEPAVVIQQVLEDSAAQEAGIEFGDKIIAANGQSITRSADLITFVRENGQKEMTVHVIRNDEELDITITPTIDAEGEPARMGVLLADAAIVRYPWYSAIFKGFAAAFFGLINIFAGFYYLIKFLILGKGLVFDVAGPVGIAVLIGQSARLGLNYLINVTATISLSLAAINILPIPALDGGRILFVIIEKITNKKVPIRYEQAAHTIGFIVLIGLILLVTGRDLLKLF